MAFRLHMLLNIANGNLMTLRKPVNLPRFNKTIIQALQRCSR